MGNEKEMPARIWIDEALGMVGYVNEPPPPESDFRYEYVRADLLATARKEEREAAARIAENPYGDDVQALGGDEPKAVGEKIAAAIRNRDHND